MERNRKEKELMYEWACCFSDTECEKIFTAIDSEAESYWNKRTDSEKYVMEYAPKTLIDYRKYLQELWGQDKVLEEIQKAVLVAIMKNEPLEEQSSGRLEAMQESLPEFIYTL